MTVHFESRFKVYKGVHLDPSRAAAADVGTMAARAAQPLRAAQPRSRVGAGGMLTMMEVPHDVRANSTDTRNHRQNRIDFLSRCAPSPRASRRSPKQHTQLSA